MVNAFGDKLTILTFNFVPREWKYVDKIERQIFRQTPCARGFSLGAQSLVKSTPVFFLYSEFADWVFDIFAPEFYL